MNTFFEVLWGEYPKTGKTAKQDAKRRFEQAINDGADPDFIIMAAKRYAAWLNSGGPSDWRPNPKNLCNWLGKGCWDDEIEEDLSEAELRIRALKARETESWGDPC